MGTDKLVFLYGVCCMERVVLRHLVDKTGVGLGDDVQHGPAPGVRQMVKGRY